MAQAEEKQDVDNSIFKGIIKWCIYELCDFEIYHLESWSQHSDGF